ALGLAAGPGGTVGCRWLGGSYRSIYVAADQYNWGPGCECRHRYLAYPGSGRFDQCTGTVYRADGISVFYGLAVLAQHRLIANRLRLLVRVVGSRDQKSIKL